MSDEDAFATEWPGRVLSATVDALRERDALPEPGSTSGARLDRCTVGDSAVLVEIVEPVAEEGRADPGRRTAGLAHRPEGASAATPPSDIEELLAPIRGAGNGFGVNGGNDCADGTARALALATLNALSAPLIDWCSGDPMALLDPSVDRIVTVGLFRPAFRKFTGVEVRVIERGAVDAVSTPAGVTMRAFTPDETEAAMEGADVVFVTGSALVYGGIERYLDAAPVSAAVVVVGATGSVFPEPLFDAGVDVLAGAKVTDPERVREAIVDGACGTDLHDRGVRKVYASHEPPAKIDLNSGA